MDSWLVFISDIVTLFLMWRTLLTSYPAHKKWVHYPCLCSVGCFFILIIIYLAVPYFLSVTFLVNTVLYPVILAFYALIFLKADFFVCLSQIMLFTAIKSTLPALFGIVMDFLETHNDVLENVTAFRPMSTANISILISSFTSRVLPTLCMVGFYFYLVRFATKEEERIPVSYWLTMVFASTVTVIWGRYSYPEYFEEEHGTFIRAIVSISFLIILLMIYYLFYRITMQYKENLELKVLQQRMKLDSEAIEDMNQLYLDLRQLRHDLLNHIGIMESLLKEKQYQELENYFQSLQAEEYQTLHSLETGNIAVNALLNRKLTQIRDLGISIRTKVIVPSRSSISDTDLCAIFANLLDNASEAAQQTSSGTIELTALPRTGYLNIQCENTVKEDPMKRNSHLQTTKSDPVFHGLGLKIIRKLVDSYDGILSIHTDNEKFNVNILLPLEEAETGSSVQTGDS